MDMERDKIKKQLFVGGFYLVLALVFYACFGNETEETVPNQTPVTSGQVLVHD
jgi:hypothetical protein